ncbi:hypothetical protein LEP1GSC103_3651 [Leptospira borgpetersenii serovar Javanica str. UI 09931]|uniref:Uncharacterized protein n=3 Tax=Leptospira borgpetersenii TaxID=174 RepID=A0A0S2IPV7_LEPBO|nr:hypothetical protein LBBP_01002 [Leptospira borgpetersenii serovar Ballum]EKP13859.1 hypothetical protein LEP1GSC128_0726 [Leptospira borgpetersenii str. 200801926]EKQ92971.1 hypothetical protein LEP1GSC101_3788 [Leptospira borgpetersenii str. UI 09149]EKQ98418.1 hypothetical protein LEP1GSC121_3278 [Leptospira borgpetersenii serovar Castellonis str. 200801910]EMK09100.1 hypothetical protein LEP1GSC066_0203 [Leptospira sp. serovar Kenya str. Sh9]EMN60041.1 hypothetical protein LEP1GSC090_32
MLFEHKNFLILSTRKNVSLYTKTDLKLERSGFFKSRMWFNHLRAGLKT